MDAPAESPLSEGAARRAARLATPRMRRELQTMAAMLRIYCHDRCSATGDAEKGRALCDDCASLLDYARKRLAACPFGSDKPTCARCTVHCYGARQREQTRVVMRHAGPRMLLRHPLLAVAHLIDGRRPAPPNPRAEVVARALAARASIDAAAPARIDSTSTDPAGAPPL